MPTTVSSGPEPDKSELDQVRTYDEEIAVSLPTRSGNQHSSRSLPVYLRSKLAELFAVDPRSLALTRIAAALVVLVDLILRSSSIGAFYSDSGLLPRVALYERFPNSWFVSLHLMNGRTEIQALLFLITGIFAFAMLVGYRTRWTSFFTWLLVSSLNARNPYVAHGGDALLNMLLFWGMFVPWAARYSVDHALDSSATKQPQRILSIGTAALLLMMPFVYFFSGMLKTGPEWRDQFTAIYYVLSAPEYATAVGRWMATWPSPILQVLTASVVVIELGGALLLFSPFATRTIRAIVIPSFLIFQVGLLLTLNLGLFPIISSIALLPFIPTSWWNKLSRRLETQTRDNLRIYYDGGCDFCRKTVLLIKEFCLLPQASMEPAQSVPVVNDDMKRHNSWVVIDHTDRAHYKFDALTYVLKQSPLFWFVGRFLSWRPLANAGRHLYETAASSRKFLAWLTAGLKHRPVQLRQPLLLSILSAIFLLYVVVDNLGSVKRAHVGVPERLKGVGQMLRINQRWRMFAPSPVRNYEWFLTEAKLRGGQQFCLVNGVSADCDQSNGPVPSFESYRWRTYWRYMGSDGEKHLRPYLARFICENWNQSHHDDTLLEQVVIYKLQKPIQPLTNDPPQKTELWSRQCLGGSK